MGLLYPPTSTAKQPGPNTQTELAVKEFAGIIKSPKHIAGLNLTTCIGKISTLPAHISYLYRF